MIEPFGPEYVRPQSKPCPDCPCCTAPLCERGRASVLRCVGHVGDENLRETVNGCPCSAESTPGTLSWRSAMVRATTFATQRPLDAEVETLLSRISEGDDLEGLVEEVESTEDDEDDEDGEDGEDKPGPARWLRLLTLRGYVIRPAGGLPAVTDFGWAYLRGRSGGRRVAGVTIRSLDEQARTAVVEIPAFAVDQPVTVPMDQILNSRTGLTPQTAVGAIVYAEVNTDALRAEHVVLTRVQDPSTVAPVSTEGAR